MPIVPIDIKRDFIVKKPIRSVKVMENKKKDDLIERLQVFFISAGFPIAATAKYATSESTKTAASWDTMALKRRATAVIRKEKWPLPTAFLIPTES